MKAMKAMKLPRTGAWAAPVISAMAGTLRAGKNMNTPRLTSSVAHSGERGHCVISKVISTVNAAPIRNWR